MLGWRYSPENALCCAFGAIRFVSVRKSNDCLVVAFDYRCNDPYSTIQLWIRDIDTVRYVFMLSLSLQIPGKYRLRNFHFVLLFKISTDKGSRLKPGPARPGPVKPGRHNLITSPARPGCDRQQRPRSLKSDPARPD